MGRAVRNIVRLKSQRDGYGEPYEIIIPAAGLGRRMSRYGAKPLLSITEDLTILQHQVNVIQNTLPNNNKIILVTGFQANRIMNYAPPSFICVENERYADTNVVRSIGMGLRACVTDRVAIIYGDLVFNKYALGFSHEESTIVIDNNCASKEEVGCVITNGYVRNVWYDLPHKWAQVVFLTGRELFLARRYCWNPQNANHFGCEMLNSVIKQGGRFKALQPYKIKTIDIDNIKDIVVARAIINEI